jgi:nitrate reductase gamma subunit
MLYALVHVDIVVTRSVQAIQDELKNYEIIFIVLATAFGILVLQGLLFVGLRRIAMRIKKQRRLTRMKSQAKL